MTNPQLRYRFFGGLLLLLAGLTPLALAQTNSWTNSISGKWEDAASWSLGVSPTNLQPTVITNANTKVVSIDAVTMGGGSTVSVWSVKLDGPSGSTNRLKLSDIGTNKVFRMLTGLQVLGGGALEITNSSLGVDGSAGTSVDVRGVVEFQSGEFRISNCFLQVVGSGRFVMNDGTLTTGDVEVGAPSDNAGTMTIAGGNVATFYMRVGGAIATTGTVWLTGGELSAFILYVGSNGTAQVTVSNGVCNARNLTVGLSNQSFGRLSIIGGSVVASNFFVGRVPGATGEVWISGGQLITTNTPVTLGNLGTGRLTVSNGTATANSLSIGPRGSLTVAGGTMVVSNLVQAGGSLLLTNGLLMTDSLRIQAGSRTKLFGGTLQTKFTSITTGLPFVIGNGTSPVTYQLNGGFHFFSNGLVVAANALLTGCGTVGVGGVITNFGTIVLTCPTTFNGSVVNHSSLLVSNGATVDFQYPVINDGIIDAVTGTVNFHSTFINNGLYLDADGDADGDGLSNLQESLAGTSPTNSASTFQIFAVTPAGDDMLVRWQAGGGRTNVVEASADLAGSYTNLSGNIILPGGGDVTTNYLDVGGATNFPARFYRISLLP